MKQIQLLIISLGIICPAMAWATVIYVSGDQTGTWPADTVIVTGEVRVPPGQSLTILPGVEVLFQVYCKLIVDSAATLRAAGTPTDSIRFDVLMPDSSWHGIRFLSASDSSRLEYCLMKHGSAMGTGEDNYGGAIYCFGSSPTISNNIIDGNSAAANGGGISCANNSNPLILSNTISENDGNGIYCKNSSPSINDNIISRNSAYQGGGIFCEINSSPIISGNTIFENSANPPYSIGGGIYCGSNSSPCIIGNIINGNSAYDYAGAYNSYGGGIYCVNCSSTNISSNTISENSASWGGGIYCSSSSLTISGNTISKNSASYVGGGIYCSNSNLAISGNIITEDSASYGGGIYLTSSNSIISSNTICGNLAYQGGGFYCNSSNPTLVNCILWGNTTSQIYGGGQVTYSNIQGGYAGIGNINVDPCFADPTNGDYHLQSTVGSYHGGLWTTDSLYSHCIDAGDPSSPFAIEPMPNGGRVNMGFEGNTLEASLSTNTSVSVPIAKLPTEFRLYAPYPNPFNPVATLSFTLPVTGKVSLIVYDVNGRQVSKLVDDQYNAGVYNLLFDGSGFSSGIYFACFRYGQNIQTRKMVLVK